MTNNIIGDRLKAKTQTDAATGCWVWSGATDDAGYGMIRIAGETRRAHRVSYETHHGPIPNGMFVCHHCDSPPCINPAHLFLGTHADNMNDRNVKGRQARHVGEAHPSAKLTESDVQFIRSAPYSWSLATRLAKQFGVSAVQIRNVRAGRNWTITPADHTGTAQTLVREIIAKTTAKQGEV